MAIPPVPSVEVVVRASWNPRLHEVSGGRTLSIVSTDSQHARLHARLQIALKYIQENAFSEAQTMINDMYSAMIEKADDPFGASVGGYFLLKFGEAARMKQMARSFYSLSPWLPDSAMIYAWQLMEEDGSDTDYEARVPRIIDALTEGARRGVPLFAIGLRFLFERLRYHSSDSSDPNRPIAKAVQQLADLLGASDEKQFLTTFFGMAPWQPTRTFDSSFIVPPDHCVQLSDFNLNYAFQPWQTNAVTPLHSYPRADETTVHANTAVMGDQIEQNIHGGTFYGPVAAKMEHCTNIIGQQVDDQRKQLLAEVQRAVTDLIQHLPDEKREDVADNLKLLLDSVTPKAPKRRWYEVSSQGLISASKIAKDFRGDIASTLIQLGKLLWTDFELPRSEAK